MALSVLPIHALVQARHDIANRPHDTQGTRLNVAVWCLTSLAAAFLVLRLYAKHYRHLKLWWDDYILIAAFVALLIQSSLLSACVHFGLGRHTWDITNWPAYLYMINLTGVCSIIAAAWSKTSFAVTLLRLSDGWMRRLIYFVIVTVNIFLGLSCIITYAQCTPVRRLWDHSVPGSCWKHNVVMKYNVFSSIWSGAMDILLSTLPWWLVSQLTLNQKERIGVIVGMSIGSLAGATSIGKTATLFGIRNPDTIATVNIMILATAESAITIIAACIPVLRVFIKNTMQSDTTRHTSRRTQPPYNSYRFRNYPRPLSSSKRSILGEGQV